MEKHEWVYSPKQAPSVEVHTLVLQAKAFSKTRCSQSPSRKSRCRGVNG